LAERKIMYRKIFAAIAFLNLDVAMGTPPPSDFAPPPAPPLNCSIVKQNYSDAGCCPSSSNPQTTMPAFPTACENRPHHACPGNNNYGGILTLAMGMNACTDNPCKTCTHVRLRGRNGTDFQYKKFDSTLTAPGINEQFYQCCPTTSGTCVMNVGPTMDEANTWFDIETCYMATDPVNANEIYLNIEDLTSCGPAPQ